MEKKTTISGDKKKSRASVLFDGKSLPRSMGNLSQRTTSRLRLRRQSFGFSSVASIRNAEKSMLQFGQEYKRPVQTYLNTYQTDPYVRFNPVQVEKAIDEILDELFTDKHKYSPQGSPELALRISGDLLRTVKGMQFNRYRILTVVTLGQKRAQSYVNAVAVLWDHERDNLVNVQREDHTCFIQTTLAFKRPLLTYLNTYQTEPRVKFNPVQVTKAAEALLDKHFTDYKYSAEESPALAMLLAGQLMREVKSMNFNRYRILSIVTIGQKRAQSYNNAIAFLWDHERDGYINVQREVHTAFIQITVFGIYLD